MDYILGDKIIFCQNTFLKTVVNCFNIANCKSSSHFMNLEVFNFLQPFDRTVDLKNIKCYQLTIGSLM